MYPSGVCHRLLLRYVLPSHARQRYISDSSPCVSIEQQTSMATTVAVSPSEYLQPATASTQVSRNITHVFVSL